MLTAAMVAACALTLAERAVAGLGVAGSLVEGCMA